MGSPHTLFLHHISTTKGNYFVAAQPLSCFQKMPLEITDALKTSDATYRFACHLFLCHCSVLPMLQPMVMPPFFHLASPHSDVSPFCSKHLPTKQIRQFLLIVSSDCSVFCLRTYGKLYFTSTYSKSRASKTHLTVPASSH